MAFEFNGQPIYVGKPFVDSDGTQYPKNWATVLSSETKAELGIVEIVDQAPIDGRFYWTADRPKNLDDETIVDDSGNELINKGLKTVWIAEQKESAGMLLAKTDWYVTRKAEASIEIPANVATYRTAIRTVSGQRETQISEAATFDAFVALVTNQPKVWDETTQAMVDNTEPHLTPWPEEP